MRTMNNIRMRNKLTGQSLHNKGQRETPAMCIYANKLRMRRVVVSFAERS